MEAETFLRGTRSMFLIDGLMMMMIGRSGVVRALGGRFDFQKIGLVLRV